MARVASGGICYHVMGRGNGKAVVYYDDGDYAAFLRLILGACERRPMRIIAYCLMPNHFHLVLWPERDGELSSWMHWLLTSHVQRHRSRHGTTGHVWQGRFKAFPIQSDHHLLRVLRYVERNPVRAGLATAAARWPWSSLRERLVPERTSLLSAPPMQLPDTWAELVDEPLTVAELEALRQCGRRGSPYGDPAWTRGTAERLEICSTLRPRGRPPCASYWNSAIPNRG